MRVRDFISSIRQRTGLTADQTSLAFSEICGELSLFPSSEFCKFARQNFDQEVAPRQVEKVVTKKKHKKK